MGLAAVSLPDPTSQVPAFMRDPDQILMQTYWYAIDTTSSSISRRQFQANLQVKDMGQVDLETLSGKEFMSDMKRFFDKKKVEKSLRAGWKIADADGENHSTVHFEWEGDDMVLHNHDVKLADINSAYYPSLFIKANLAVEMGWFIDKGGNSYDLGPNLVIKIPDGTIPTPLDIPNHGNNKFWSYGAGSGMIRLSLTCNWRFKNLNKAFDRVVEASQRPLFIYSDMGSSSVVGNQVTDLLREVSYKREGIGSQYFEPLHIQYIPVRKDTIDIIETQVAETGGALTQFGTGNTIVTLHFKKT